MMTAETTFDPSAQLPGAPDPWASTDMPSLRDGPPYHMTDMIAAEPALARRLLAALGGPGAAADLAAAIEATIERGEPVTIVGCGTSEHAALAAAEILAEAAVAAGHDRAIVTAVQAFEASLQPPAAGLVIGISHEGGTAATNAALAAARAAGRQIALVTVTRRSPAGAIADIVVETTELDQGWCHVIGYLSPIVAAAAVGGHLSGRSLDSDAVARLLASGARDTTGAEHIATGLAAASRIIVIASGADRSAGRELVLKIEEGSWVPSAYRDLETFLHGHLPAVGPSTAVVLLLADREGRSERANRGRQALAAARAVGARTAAIATATGTSELDPELTLGRITVDDAPDLPAPVAAILGTVTPLQLVTERLARARGTNPDPIRRDDPTYRAASEAGER
jgi:glucosamine--fructose-6-phosphate aminotransferase (isomerizing)